MRFLAIAAVTAILGACATPCPDVSNVTETARFNCEDDSVLTVTFSNEAARVEQEGYTAVDLPARVVSGGYRYADGGNELRGRGVQVRWQRPGAAETICHRAPFD